MTPQQKQARDKLLDDMYYNLAPGIHTYHACECGRGTRCEKCVCCQADEVRELELDKEQGNGKD